MTSLTTILTTLALALGLSFSTPAEAPSVRPDLLGPTVTVDDPDQGCGCAYVYDENTGEPYCPCD